MLVEDVSVRDSLRRFLEGAGADEQIGNEIDEKQLPGLQAAVFLDKYGCGEQDGCDGDEGYLPLCAAVGVTVMLVLVLVVVVPLCVLMGVTAVTAVAAVSLAVELLFCLWCEITDAGMQLSFRGRAGCQFATGLHDGEWLWWSGWS